MCVYLSQLLLNIFIYFYIQEYFYINFFYVRFYPFFLMLHNTHTSQHIFISFSVLSCTKRAIIIRFVSNRRNFMIWQCHLNRDTKRRESWTRAFGLLNAGFSNMAPKGCLLLLSMNINKIGLFCFLLPFFSIWWKMNAHCSNESIYWKP